MNRITSTIGLYSRANAQAYARGAERDDIVEPTLNLDAGRRAGVDGCERIVQASLPAGIDAGSSLPSILDALGVAALICTPTAQVTFATAAARMLLQRGDAIRLAKQASGSEVLATSDRQTTLRLARSISLAAAGLSPSLPGAPSGCTLAVSRSEDAAPLVLAIAPFAGAVPVGSAAGMASTAPAGMVETGAAGAVHALIVVSDPDAEDGEFALRIQSAFGLTRAETRLAVALARGICRKAYARSIGVQPSTVKTQITNLFAKTGTRRESDLVRILASVPRLAWPGR